MVKFIENRWCEHVQTWQKWHGLFYFLPFWSLQKTSTFCIKRASKKPYFCQLIWRCFWICNNLFSGHILRIFGHRKATFDDSNLGWFLENVGWISTKKGSFFHHSLGIYQSIVMPWLKYGYKYIFRTNPTVKLEKTYPQK